MSHSLAAHSSACYPDHAWLPSLHYDSVTLSSSSIGLKMAWKYGWSYRIALFLLFPGTQWLLDYFIWDYQTMPINSEVAPILVTIMFGVLEKHFWILGNHILCLTMFMQLGNGVSHFHELGPHLVSPSYIKETPIPAPHPMQSHQGIFFPLTLS